MELLEGFERLDDLIDKNDTDYFPPAQKIRFIKMATYEYIETRGRAWEKDQQARDDLSPITSEDTITLTSGSGPLPEDYHRALNISNGGNPIRMIQISDLNSVRNDPDAKGTVDDPIGYIIKGSTLKVEPNSLTEADIIYFSKPIFGQDNSDEMVNLKDDAQEEIIKIAHRQMIHSITDPRYQQGMNEDQMQRVFRG